MIVAFMLIIIGVLGMMYASKITGFINAMMGASIVLMLTAFVRMI